MERVLSFRIGVRVEAEFAHRVRLRSRAPKPKLATSHENSGFNKLDQYEIYAKFQLEI